MLARYFGVLANADSRSVVTVEQHMTQLVESIETLKGSLRLLEHQLQYANVVVSFRFRERQAPTYNATSSFPWLNDVSLDRLQQEFARD
jgi:hypothetical protein